MLITEYVRLCHRVLEAEKIFLRRVLAHLNARR